jgi:hypothetical protein
VILTKYMRCLILTFCLIVTGAFATGCRSLPDYQPPASSTQPLTVGKLTDAVPIGAVDALVSPPVGWQQEETKSTEDHVHFSWKSPSGKTNYGVIYFSIPLPLPASWIYDRYIAAMRQSEGEAKVIAGPANDSSLPGVRFTVETGPYRMRTNLVCKGFHGWSVYAGTLRNQPEVAEELALAERARDKTQLGLPSAAAAPNPAVIRPTAAVSE